MTTVRIMTPPAPGAIAILQIEGDLERLLTELSERNWASGTARLVAPGDIDDCLAVRIDATTAQLMPHGGPRVQQRLLDWLASIDVHTAAMRHHLRKLSAAWAHCRLNIVITEIQGYLPS